MNKILNIILLISFINLIESTNVPKKKLSSGYYIPMVGLGTWQITPDDVDKVVSSALNSGYRHIDTAFVYYNEEAIGKSLKKWFDNGGKREDLFVTTKLPHFANRVSDVEKVLNKSLEYLGLDYIDLYLNHQPFAFKPNSDFSGPMFNSDGTVQLESGNDNDIVAVWKEMERLVKTGRIRSIGLSNFNKSQILRIIESAEIKPSNLQVEFHAYFQQKELQKLCKEHNIVMTGYSTLGGTPKPSNTNEKSSVKLMKHPEIKKIADKYNKTPAHILLRHAHEKDIVVIPKSNHEERLKSNLDIFDFKLSKSDVDIIDSLDLGEKGRTLDFFFFKGTENHPEYPFRDYLKYLESLKF